jgi:hypothetical protein
VITSKSDFHSISSWLYSNAKDYKQFTTSLSSKEVPV